MVCAAESEASEAVATYSGYIKGETLATQMIVGDPTTEAHQSEVRLGTERVRIGLTRVGSLLDSR